MIKAQFVGSHGAEIDGLMFDCTSFKTPNGYRVNRGGVAPKLCRQLIAAGHDPETQIAFYRGETLCFHPSSLGWWAAIAVKEPDRGSVHFAKYQEMDQTAVDQAA